MTGPLKNVLSVIMPADTWYFYDFYRDVLSTIEITSMAQDYGFLVYTPHHSFHPSWDKFYSTITELVDGFVVVAPYPEEPFIAYASSLVEPKPIVLLFSRSSAFSSIGMDNEHAVFEAVNHLLNLGHTKIGTITGDLRSVDGQERYQAFLKALKNNGIDPHKEWIVEGDFSRLSGREALMGMWRSMDRPTAIFAGNDHMALGALELCKERNIRVPDDLAIVGCDDKPSSSLTLQPMTTVRQPVEEIARRGTLMLINQIQTGLNEKIEVSVSGKLVVRETSGASL